MRTEEWWGHFTQMTLSEEVKNNGEEIWETNQLIWLKYIVVIKCVVLCKMCKSLTLNSIFCHIEKSPHICLCVCVLLCPCVSERVFICPAVPLCVSLKSCSENLSSVFIYRYNLWSLMYYIIVMELLSAVC